MAYFIYKKLKSNNLGKTEIKKLKSKISKKKFKNLNKNSKEIKYSKQNRSKGGDKKRHIKANIYKTKSSQ